jgi:hypothetical protein
MNKFIINNSTVYININEETASDAKDKLLTKLYYARHKETMGGYTAWHKLLDMYYISNYQGMREFIMSCRGRGGKTRNECIALINIIEGGVRCGGKKQKKRL